ncbi:MAG: hypothetical protein L6Q38_18010, partial [Nitrospira sp.]|nr:hypothetical protein [Nitrospira sp.]
MKPLRSLLLDRHQAATPQLDRIRSRVVSQIRQPSLAATPRSNPVRLWRVLWHELFHKPRVAWAGIGACGLLALGLNGMALLTSDAEL